MLYLSILKLIFTDFAPNKSVGQWHR